MIFSKKTIYPVLILTGGIAISIALFKLNKKPPRKHKSTPQSAPLIEARTLEKEDYQVIVRGTGISKPRFNLALSSPVSGQVLWVDPRLIPGGRFKKGDILFKLDPTDYLLAWEEARYQLASAEFDLKLAAANKQTSYRRGTDNKNLSALARHEPQMKKANALLQVAQARLKQAKRNLERTNIVASFDGYISEVNLAVGQMLNKGQEAGRFHNLDSVLLEISVSMHEYQNLIKSGLEPHQANLKARVFKKIGDQIHNWYGTITEVIPSININDKQITLVTEVTQPVSDQGLMMPNGLFIHSEIQGPKLKSVYRLPSTALRDENQIWVIGEENQLATIPVTLVHQNEDIFFTGDINTDKHQLAVISRSSGVKPGMTVRVHREKGSL